MADLLRAPRLPAAAHPRLRWRPPWRVVPRAPVPAVRDNRPGAEPECAVLLAVVAAVRPLRAREVPAVSAAFRAVAAAAAAHRKEPAVLVALAGPAKSLWWSGANGTDR